MLTSMLLLATLPSSVAEDARLIMVGNSYTAQNSLHELVAQALEGTVPGWSQVKGHPLTQGGATLDQHAAQADGTNGATPWREALVTGAEAGSWDWVVLQDQSQVPGFPQSNSQWQASRDGALILDDIIQDGGAETVFLLTWGRRDGDSGNPDRYPDFLTMQERLTEGYLAYALACAADGSQPWVIPAGHAWRTIHQDLEEAGLDPSSGETDFTALYSSDGSHPSLAGSYLAAISAAAALTGRSVAQVQPPPGVDEALAATLRDAADRTVLDEPFGQIPYRWAFAWEDWQSPEDVEVELDDLDSWVIISDTITRPAVSVTHDAGELDLVLVGATHQESQAGAGRLWLLDGGALSVTRMASCTDGCEVVLQGGSLDIGSGDLGSLTHLAGTLMVSDTLDLQSDYSLGSEATLQISAQQADSAPVTVHGTVSLAGSLEVQVSEALRDAAEPVPLIRSPSIDLGLLSSSLPPGASGLELSSDDGDQLLSLVWDADTGPSTSEDTGPSPDPDGGCDCASTAGGRPPWWLVLVALLPLLRRAQLDRPAWMRSQR